MNKERLENLENRFYEFRHDCDEATELISSLINAANSLYSSGQNKSLCEQIVIEIDEQLSWLEKIKKEEEQ